VLLTVWRHGEAGIAATDDARPLTPRGRSDITAGAAGYAEWLRRVGCPPVASIWFSPTRRTKETAALLSTELAPTRIGVDEALAPGAIPEDFHEFDGGEDKHIVFVSHQPFVSSAIALWADDPTLLLLAPGGYSALDVLCLERGGASVLSHCPDPQQEQPDRYA
jgi:phosphohistidine phosphatase